jgi:hypothetical protein
MRETITDAIRALTDRLIAARFVHNITPGLEHHLSITNANTLAARLRAKVEAAKSHVASEGVAAERIVDAAIEQLKSATDASKIAATKIAAGFINEAQDLVSELKRMDNGGPALDDLVAQVDDHKTPVPAAPTIADGDPVSPPHPTGTEVQGKPV